MSPKGNAEKPRLDREQLRKHGIDFVETIANTDELEDWLRPIYRSITRLPTDIPIYARNKFKEELLDFGSRGQDRDEAQSKHWCLEPDANQDNTRRRNPFSSTESMTASIWFSFPSNTGAT